MVMVNTLFKHSFTVMGLAWYGSDTFVRSAEVVVGVSLHRMLMNVKAEAVSRNFRLFRHLERPVAPSK